MNFDITYKLTYTEFWLAGWGVGMGLSSKCTQKLKLMPIKNPGKYEENWQIFHSESSISLKANRKKKRINK